MYLYFDLDFGLGLDLYSYFELYLDYDFVLYLDLYDYYGWHSQVDLHIASGM